MNPIDVAEKLALVSEPWTPKIIAELNGQEVKVVRLEGSFVWHRHDEADELFWVLEGRLRMDFRGREVWLEPGQMIVVPRGVEHRPHCDEPTAVLLFEPAGTLNTGDAESELTVEEPERI
jgi:mannose-6-phosphate isomerase-like protein (cupin superfamily)